MTATGPTSANAAAMREKLAALDAEHAKAVAGGGERYVERHHARGKLLPRERIELLVDEGSAFLELSPLAGWGSDFAVGASIVTGIGVIEGVECLIPGQKRLARLRVDVSGGVFVPYGLYCVVGVADVVRGRPPHLVVRRRGDLPDDGSGEGAACGEVGVWCESSLRFDGAEVLDVPAFGAAEVLP